MNPTASQGRFQSVLRTVTDRELIADILVFIAYFATAKLAQYILFTLHTSPALIWAPTGIALAAVLIRGNKMWVPIMLAYLAAILTLPGYLPLENKLIATVGFTIQPLIGAYLFRRMGSNGTVHRGRDVMILMAGAAVTAAIGPLFNTIGQITLGALAETMLITFSRAWAGGLLGIIVVTPFIAGWYHSPSWPIKRSQLAEAVSAFGFLTLAIYLLFWTSFPSLVFLLIFFLCVTLFWISFRFGSRVNTSAIMYLTVMGILGSIVAHPTPTALNTQLFADELFLLLIAPIFFQFFALMEERRQAELHLSTQVIELERVTQQLAENDNAKNEFIAILAHELRNPLSTVVTTLELLKIENPGIESAALIGRAEQQTLGMRRLLDDLLDVARIAEKKFNIVREGADLSTVITRAIEATAETVREHKHTLRVSMPEDTVPLYVDPIRIEQVIVNLITNASKYTPAGGNIWLSAEITNGAFEIVVRDSGKGIPRERLEQIFLPFRQLDPSSHRSSGIGIGLFLTRQIVEMHDGTIRAESKGEQKGSSFIVNIPMSHDWVSPKKTSVSAVTNHQKGKRILVVDDNEAAAIGMQKLLTHHGYEAHAVHSGTEAIKQARAFAPDVILLDIGLPDMSGHTAARTIRAEQGTRRLRLIALTGYGQDSDRAAALESGFDLHLTKPVGSADIAAALASLDGRT